MNFVISGKVVKGDGYGRKLGFPTVNLEVKDQVLPTEGVYAGIALLENKNYRAGIVVRPRDKVDPVRNREGSQRPPVSNGIEAHLIGYDGDAYGKVVTLKIQKFLREFKKFDTEEELIIQIKEDLEACK